MWVAESAARDRLGALLVDAAHALVDDERTSIDNAELVRYGIVEREKDGLTMDAQGMSSLPTAVADKQFHRNGVLTSTQFLARDATIDPADHVCSVDDPRREHPKGAALTVAHLGNVVVGRPVRYVNVPTAPIRKLAADSIVAGGGWRTLGATTRPTRASPRSTTPGSTSTCSRSSCAPTCCGPPCRRADRAACVGPDRGARPTGASVGGAA